MLVKLVVWIKLLAVSSLIAAAMSAASSRVIVFSSVANFYVYMVVGLSGCLLLFELSVLVLETALYDKFLRLCTVPLLLSQARKAIETLPK